VAIVSARGVVAVSFPEEPVMVRGYWPRAAVLLAVNVSTLAEGVEFGLNDAVTPLGSPETERLTLPANPYCGYALMVVELELPGANATPPGFESVKPGAKIPSATKPVAVWVPETPVTVRVYCPKGAVGATVRVSAELDNVGFVANDAVTPVGSPDTDRFTLPENPYSG
jgi:hypothetical protein